MYSFQQSTFIVCCFETSSIKDYKNVLIDKFLSSIQKSFKTYYKNKTWN
jgi:hypothetical protein